MRMRSRRSIPNYRIEQLLGVGSCGVVYLASDVRTGAREWPSRFSRRVIAGCPKSSDMFVREAKTFLSGSITPRLSASTNSVTPITASSW